MYCFQGHNRQPPFLQMVGSEILFLLVSLFPLSFPFSIPIILYHYVTLLFGYYWAGIKCLTHGHCTSKLTFYTLNILPPLYPTASPETVSKFLFLFLSVRWPFLRETPSVLISIHLCLQDCVL